MEDCDGIYGTLDQAITELDNPRIKIVRSNPSFKGDLRLGNPEKYSSALCIQVERYYRTYFARPPPASTFVHSSRLPVGQESTQSSATVRDGDTSREHDTLVNPLTAVRSARDYQVVDAEAPGGKRDVQREDLAKGYEYGRTAVHISQSDENITKLETEAALELIGFIPSEKVKPLDYLAGTFSTNWVIV